MAEPFSFTRNRQTDPTKTTNGTRQAKKETKMMQAIHINGELATEEGMT